MGDPAEDIPDQAPVKWVSTSRIVSLSKGLYATEYDRIGLDRYGEKIE